VVAGDGEYVAGLAFLQLGSQVPVASVDLVVGDPGSGDTGVRPEGPS